MIFVKNLEEGKRKIIELYPQFKESNFVGDESGWCNYAIKVDNEYLFRFSRDNESYRTLQMEYNILKDLRHRLPINIEVPNYTFNNLSSELPFVGYKMLQGEFLNEEIYKLMSIEEKSAFLNNISTFINVMHSISIKSNKLDFVEPISNYKMRYNEFKKVCFKYFNDQEKDVTKKLFENYFLDNKMTNYTPTVIHGDLSENHIILTDNGIGIIDFGDTRIFDPAYDFIWAYLLDENLYSSLIEKYNGNYDENFLYRIKEFYIKITPYYGIVYGDKINNKQLIKAEIENLNKYLL